MKTKDFWKNKTVLVTAGPTKEYIDPVRFITNESSGKTGYAIAEYLNQLGADVCVVSGPITIKNDFPVDKVIHVTTALEMYKACKKLLPHIDVVIFAAAVADYRPKEESKEKIKKTGDEIEITLIKNPDIALEFGKVKRENQLSIGFALETTNIFEYGTEKLIKKNFDFIVINSPNLAGEGFGGDTNRVSILTSNLEITHFDKKSKKMVAEDIIEFTAKNLLKLND